MSETAKKTASAIAKRMLDTGDEFLWNQLHDALIEAGYPREAREHINCQHSRTPLFCIVLEATAEGDWGRMDAWEKGPIFND